MLLCVDLIVTLLCVKHNLLQCFSSGGSKELGMQPKRGSRDRSERVADCIQPKKLHQQKHNSKCFSDARLSFKKTYMKAVDTSVRCSLSKECLRKTCSPDSVSAVR